MPAPEPQPRCGDTSPEDHAGSVVDDGFDDPAPSWAEQFVDRLGDDYAPPPKGSWLEPDGADRG